MIGRIIHYSTYILFYLVGMLFAQPVLAQSNVNYDATYIDILAVNESNYPQITLMLTARDNSGNQLPLFDDKQLKLFENGKAITKYTSEYVQLGVDITAVIDANWMINAINSQSDPTSRIDKIKQALTSHIETYLAENDTFSLYVPNAEGTDVLPLLVSESDTAVIIDTINSYYPPNPAPEKVEIQAIMQSALENVGKMNASTEEPRFRPVVIFTEGSNLGEQLDYDTVLPLIKQSNATVYGVLIGDFAGVVQYNALAELYAPSKGYALHMPDAENFDQLSSTINKNSKLASVTYTTTVTTADTELSVKLGETTTITNTDLSPLIADVRWVTMESINNFPESTDVMTLTTEFVWPNGNEEPMESYLLTILSEDGETVSEQKIDADEVIEQDGRISFPWQLSELDSGVYQLQFTGIDKRGITHESAVLQQELFWKTTTVEQISDPSPTAESVIEPTAEPQIEAETADDKVGFFNNLPSWVIPALGVLAALGVVSWFFGRKKPKTKNGKAVETSHPAPIAETTARQKPEPTNIIPIPTDPVKLNETQRHIPNGKLQFIPTNYHSHHHTVDLLHLETRIGSDDNLVDLLIEEEFVAPLHAIIRYTNGEFVIYDNKSSEGLRVNYALIYAPRILKEGDEIGIGNILLRFKAPTTQ